MSLAILPAEEIADQALTVRDVRMRVNAMAQVLADIMKKDVHYGIIPGCPKPSLYKAGAEKIAMTFRLAISTVVEDLSVTDEIHYRITAKAHGPDGRELGDAVGECSSNEEKYKWRRPVCDAEWDEAPADRRREKWTRQGKIKQVRTEPADVANTILQMADKRAYVAVVRKVTAASDIFTQDVEDMPAEFVDQSPERAPIVQPQRKAAPAEKLFVNHASEKSGETNGKAWRMTSAEFSDGRTAVTFDTPIAVRIREACDQQIPVRVVFSQGKKGLVIDSLELVVDEPGSEG